MTEPFSDPAVPELHLDPDGRPIVVFDLQGDPRDLTVWGAVMACDNEVVALIATDTEDPPTGGELMALADALNPARVDLLIAARAQAEAATAELARQADRVVGLAEEVEQLRREAESMRGKRDRAREHAVRNERERDDARAEIADLRAELAVAHEHIDGLAADRDAARSAGRDVARLAVIALTRSIKPRTHPRKTR